jgi:hypothetical protein
MFTTILLAITPFVINAVTSLIKKLPTFESLRVSRKPAIRLLAGVISLIYVGVGMWINPELVSEDMLTTSVQALGLAFVAWMSSLGSYQAFIKKE